MARNSEQEFHKEGIYFDEKSEKYAKRIKLLDPKAYAPELQGDIDEINAYLRSISESYADLQNRIELMEYTIESGIWSMKYNEQGVRTDIDWSDGVRHLLGFESEEDFPNTFDAWVNILAPAMASTAREVFDDVTSFKDSPALTKMDYPMRHKNGEWRWYHSTGKIMRREDGSIEEYIGTYRDITAEHNKDIYISQLKTIGSMFDFMCYINLEDHSFVQFTTNDQIEQHRDDLGRDIFDSFYQIADLEIAEEFREEAKRFYNPDTLQERLRETGRTSLEIYNDKTGQWFRLVYIGAEQDEEGNYKSVMFVSGDITEDKQKDILQKAELEKALVEAEAANKAKTAFLFNMSHDIRTPLNAIIGFTELEGKEPGNAEKNQIYRQKVQLASHQLLDILNNVLEMSRIESNKVIIEEELLNAGEFLNTWTGVFDGEIRKQNLSIETDCIVEHLFLYADRTHLSEVFMNILSNSVKYTPDGGRIYVTTRELPGKSNEECIIETTIRDTGIGMSEEFIREIFEEFTRERNSSQSGIQGTGLGMAIVKRLVELMHGEISITSKVGAGTTVTVRIPHRIGKDPSERTETERNNGMIDFTGKRILMAEDIDVNAMLATELLKMRGFEVERARDGVECVNMLSKAASGYYDLILMDIQMPDLNGYEATRKIRQMEDAEKASIPILAMTANAFKEDQDMAHEAGMNGHIAKPLEIEKMFSTIADTFQKFSHDE